MKKIVLLTLKIVPVVGALCCALNAIFSYYNIDLAWTGYILYFAFLLGWFALAIYFKFCSFYFILISYILLSEVINLIDYHFDLPFSDKGIFVLHCGLIGFIIIFFTYLHVRDTKKVKQHLKKVR